MLISNVTELVMGETYVVCCGYETFKPMKYNEAGLSTITNFKTLGASNTARSQRLDSNSASANQKQQPPSAKAKQRYSAWKKGRGAFNRRDAAESAAANETRVTPFFTPFVRQTMNQNNSQIIKQIYR